MYKPFRTAAVLGAGVMGAQIAAHLANAGLKVFLLDLPATEGKRNSLVEGLFKRAKKLKPTPFFSGKIPSRITLGNLEDDFHRLSVVDLVIESVVEDLQVKRDLLARVETVVNNEAVISTNTSGLPIRELAQGLSESFRRRFLGTHFFNPPRYMKLLELIPTSDTAPEVLERVKEFGRVRLGKGIVVAKDTPYFIGSRCGGYANIFNINRLAIDGDYTLEEIDFLTGTLIGFPKSATFRSADVVGIDTAVEVLDKLYNKIPDDESREVFRVPNLMKQLIERGALGAKTKRGFYKKEGKQILSINPQTLEYELPKPMNLGDEVEAIAKIKDLPTRLRALYKEPGRAGAFLRKFLLEFLGYYTRRIPEIADSPLEIDRALRWGWAWTLGPFQMWDAIGWETVLADLKAAGIRVAEWVEQMQQSGATSFYKSLEEYYYPAKGYASIVRADDEISLAAIKSEPKNTLWENAEAALLDLGDGVVLYEFRSHGNVLTTKIVEGMLEVIDLIEKGDFRGLVIGNEGQNFCNGANLQEPDLNAFQNKGQEMVQRINYASKPIVAALHGSVLGGGCELAMAAHQVVAAAESYIGLVELGVGLIPAGGGLMRMAAWAAERTVHQTSGEIMPFLQYAFDNIASARVSNSALEAQEMGYLSSQARIVLNSDRRFHVAKEEVMRLADEGFAPLPMLDNISVLGINGRAKLEAYAYQFLQGDWISDYDYQLAKCVARVLTGGEFTGLAQVDEDYLLKLERETFGALLGEQKTQERIKHMLTNKKPLRN